MSETGEEEYNQPDHFKTLTPEQQSILLTWIQENLIESKNFNTRHSAYGMKAIFGNSENGFFIYNGDFSGAMLKLGFKVKDRNVVNWVFNIRESSPAFKAKKRR